MVHCFFAPVTLCDGILAYWHTFHFHFLETNGRLFLGMHDFVVVFAWRRGGVVASRGENRLIVVAF